MNKTQISVIIVLVMIGTINLLLGNWYNFLIGIISKFFGLGFFMVYIFDDFILDDLF